MTSSCLPVNLKGAWILFYLPADVCSGTFFGGGVVMLLTDTEYWDMEVGQPSTNPCILAHTIQPIHDNFTAKQHWCTGIPRQSLKDK